jgi:hypothetical protein
MRLNDRVTEAETSPAIVAEMAKKAAAERTKTAAKPANLPKPGSNWLNRRGR